MEINRSIALAGHLLFSLLGGMIMSIIAVIAAGLIFLAISWACYKLAIRYDSRDIVLTVASILSLIAGLALLIFATFI